MKILFIQLSDLHIADKNDIQKFNLDKIVTAIKTFNDIGKYILIINGDLTKSGNLNQMKVARRLIYHVLYALKELSSNFVDVYIVPGNHDLNILKTIYGQLNEEQQTDVIKKYFNDGNMEELLFDCTSQMDEFYELSERFDCFKVDRIVSMHYNKEANSSIKLINTAPLSMIGGDLKDKGLHYLQEKHFEDLERRTDNCVNIMIMHHNTEWFVPIAQQRLDKIIAEKYNIVFTGHEHLNVSKNEISNLNDNTIIVQAPSLSGDKLHKRGFSVVEYNTDSGKIIGYNYEWKDELYVQAKTLDTKIFPKSSKQFKILPEMKEFLTHTESGDYIDNYFVCPDFKATLYDDSEMCKNFDISNENDLIREILTYSKTLIVGDNKYGKTTVIKKIFMDLYNTSDYLPVLLLPQNFKRTTIDKLIKNCLGDCYHFDETTYARFEQTDKNKRIALIDDADSIKDLGVLLDKISPYFAHIVIVENKKYGMDFKEEIINALDDKYFFKVEIHPFFYAKRMQLIKKIYFTNFNNTKKCNDEIRQINDLINAQSHFIMLDPEFITNFIKQYKMKYNLGQNNRSVFNEVYTTSIMQRLIDESEEFAPLYIKVLEEIAFYMHFNKMNSISISEIEQKIKEYNSLYRQRVSTVNFINHIRNSKIMYDDSGKYSFNDNNMLSFFVAKSINSKISDEDYSIVEDTKNKLEYTLKNLCFSINSDIIMFLVLITDNTKLIYLILTNAENFFANIQEFSFEKNNIDILGSSNIEIKDSIPDDSDKSQRESALSEVEKLEKDAQIKLKDKYDYTEEDLDKFSNKLFKGLKYLEILSKILPSFSVRLKASQQDVIVKLLYKIPNQFIYFALKDIDENLDEYISDILEEHNSLKRERKITETHVKNLINQFASMFVISIYLMVSHNAANSATIEAFNAFDEYNKSENYKVMNLMLQERSNNFGVFNEKAKDLLNSKYSLVKIITRLTIRNYFLEHDIPIKNQAQTLFDLAFPNSRYKNALRTGNAKNRLVSK